ncbi:MAG: hypothetical protein J6K73_14220 [Clostridia bacterium]|nr:hypothetical protein [Clostridia bacterium]
MAANTTRILIETIVRKTLRDIQNAPERSIRNLVDMALNFSKGRFQKSFFEGAQRMLANEHSAYYPLVRNVVNHVDHERLLRFGMNIGYNSCTLGARKIREIETSESFNIPWALFLELKADSFAQHASSYDSLILQGKELGIYTWFLCMDDIRTDIFDLMKKHDDCAFGLICNAQTIGDEILDEVAGLNHIMLSVQMNEHTDALCAKMRKRKLLYAVHTTYSSSDLKDILNDNMLYDMQSALASFTVLIPDADCSAIERELVFDYVLRKRGEQKFSTIIWDMVYDVLSIDTIVSEDSCSAGFGTDGTLFTLADRKNHPKWNLFEHDLQTILKNCFPK